MVISSASATHINGAPDLKIADLSAFRSKAQIRNDIEAVAETRDNWDRVETYKNAAGLGYDIGQVATAPSYNATNDNCSSVACHNGFTTTKWADTFQMDCSSCHTSLPQ